MPTSAIFMQYFENVVEAEKEKSKILLRQADGKPVQRAEIEEIYKHLTTNFRNAYGNKDMGAWTWLNDYFEQDGNDWFVKQVVGIEKGKVKFAPRKSLESCLNKDGFANFKKRNSQGLLTEEKGTSYSQGENVYFYNYTENPFLRFKNKINLLCITSKYEGTPNVMGEAMSYKIPILAPKEVGLAKKFLKNGKLGYLYKSGDEHSLKGEIKKICNNYASATLKAKYAWKSMDRFNKKNTLFKIKKILDNL
jgi:glycosyltransferase involved in cell wall biosynthesis